MCAKISTDCTQYPVPNLINLKEVSYEDRLGLLTKSILDGYSGSDLSDLNFGDNECCYCSKLGAIGADR